MNDKIKQTDYFFIQKIIEIDHACVSNGSQSCSLFPEIDIAADLYANDLEIPSWFVKEMVGWTSFMVPGKHLHPVNASRKEKN